MRIISLLSYTLVPLRVLPKPIRAKIWFVLSSLLFLLADSTSWREAWKFLRGWWAMRRLTLAAGQVFAMQEPMTYRREWSNIRGEAPVDEMIAWMRKAVNAGPGVCFSMGLHVGAGKAVWGQAFGVLADFLPAQEDFRAFLAQKKFDGENLSLTILPAAALGGVQLRELPAD